MSVKLITFDLDDTLWDTAPVIVSAEATLREWLGEQAPAMAALPVEHLQGVRANLLAEQPQLKHRISELRRRILKQCMLDAGYAPGPAQDLSERAFEVFLEARHRLEIFPEVTPTLESLSLEYRLGVLTNGNADVRRLGLADYFSFALCAEDLGIGKPDPELFRHALKLGNVQAEEAVHVGDHPSDDIAGALGAGLRAVWYNPQGKPWSGERPAHAQIASLSELLPLLARWRED